MMDKINRCIFDWRWWLIRNTIWDKVSADIKKEFNNEPVYDKIFLKSKIKSHSDEVTDKKNLKGNSNYTCLAVIALYSALKERSKYYSQMFLKERK